MSLHPFGACPADWLQIQCALLDYHNSQHRNGDGGRQEADGSDISGFESLETEWWRPVKASSLAGDARVSLLV